MRIDTLGRIALGTAAASLLAVAAPAHADPSPSIQNGRFAEHTSPPLGDAKWVTLDRNDNLPGWSIEGGNVDLLSQRWAQAPAGMNALSPHGRAATTVSQTIETTKETTYTVKFLYGTDTWGGCTGGSGGNEQLQVSAGQDAGQVFDAGVPNKRPNWKDGEYTFTATGSVTRLAFSSLVPRGGCGPIFTNVRIEESGSNQAAPIVKPVPFLTAHANSTARPAVDVTNDGATRINTLTVSLTPGPSGVRFTGDQKILVERPNGAVTPASCQVNSAGTEKATCQVRLDLAQGESVRLVAPVYTGNLKAGELPSLAFTVGAASPVKADFLITG